MLNTSRSDFVLPLSSVAGVTGYEFRPTGLAAGDAWPLIASMDASEGYDYLTSWRVLVVLPSDERAAATQFETWTPLLIDALRPVAFVESVAPVTIQTSAGEIPGIQLTARSD
jgi:hypothetical protein